MRGFSAVCVCGLCIITLRRSQSNTLFTVTDVVCARACRMCHCSVPAPACHVSVCRTKVVALGCLAALIPQPFCFVWLGSVESHVLWSRARLLTSLDKPRRIQFPLFDIPPGPVFQTLLKVTGCWCRVHHTVSLFGSSLSPPFLPSAPFPSLTRNSPLSRSPETCGVCVRRCTVACVRALCGLCPWR